MKKRNKKILGYGILSTLAIAAAVAVPVSLTVNYNSSSNKNSSSISKDLFLLIWDEVQKQVSSLTDLNDVSSTQNILVNKINEILKKSGYSFANVTSVNIELSPSTDGDTQIAKPVTIIFSNNITGESEYFDINSNQLISKNPIQTGILNNQTPDGFDLSSVNAQIYEKITAVVNSNWTDINDETSIEAGLVEAINSVVEPLGGKVTSVNIELVNGETYKNATPITITFEQKITGTYENFTANGNTLVTIEPIQTGISKFMSPDGIIIPDDVIINIWNVVVQNVGKDWTSITQKTQIEEKLKPAIQEFLDSEGVPISVNAVSIGLVDNLETSFKDAMPITITFDQNVAGQYTNFEVNSENKMQLVSTTPIETGISIYYDDNGNVILPSVALDKIIEKLNYVFGKYWNYEYVQPMKGLSGYYDQAIQEFNDLLPKNFPLMLRSISEVANSSLIETDKGKFAVNVQLNFVWLDDTYDNLNIILPEGYEGVGKTGPNNISFSNIMTNVNFFLFTEENVMNLSTIVKNYMLENWTNDSVDINSCINTSELIEILNASAPFTSWTDAEIIELGVWDNRFFNNAPNLPADGHKWIALRLKFAEPGLKNTNCAKFEGGSTLMSAGTQNGYTSVNIWTPVNVSN